MSQEMRGEPPIGASPVKPHMLSAPSLLPTTQATTSLCHQDPFMAHQSPRPYQRTTRQHPQAPFIARHLWHTTHLGHLGHTNSGRTELGAPRGLLHVEAGGLQRHLQLRQLLPAEQRHTQRQRTSSGPKGQLGRPGQRRSAYVKICVVVFFSGFLGFGMCSSRFLWFLWPLGLTTPPRSRQTFRCRPTHRGSNPCSECPNSVRVHNGPKQHRVHRHGMGQTPNLALNQSCPTKRTSLTKAMPTTSATTS